MATQGAWLGASRRLILSFVLALLVPATAVVWLGVRLIEQDRAVASRQLRERRESAADRLIAGLEQAVSSTERRLDVSQPACQSGLTMMPYYMRSPIAMAYAAHLPTEMERGSQTIFEARVTFGAQRLRRPCVSAGARQARIA